jgi:translation initiation factor 1
MSRERDALVYSSATGRMCPECRRPIADCRCRENARAASTAAADGIIRIRREVKGRGGKTVTTISGLRLTESALRDLAGELSAAAAPAARRRTA